MTESSQRELELKSRELDLRERELELAAGRARAERWRNPLTVAVIAAALAGFSNAYVAYANSRAQLALEARRAESERILEVIKAGEPSRVRENLRFLLQLGLVQDENLRIRITAWEADPRRAPAYLWRNGGTSAEGAVVPPRPPRQQDAAPRPSRTGRSGY
ncbi:MAG TPA: hypothetical protein VGW40_05885 [Allosphingosinicella sp.]|nr:hypothetical protein [Allosphingosinicella sp.]